MISPKRFSQSFSLVALLIAVIAIGYLVFREIPRNVFAYDILGYYLYIPVAFEFNDLTLSSNYDNLLSVLSKYGTSEGFCHAFKAENGNWVMRFPMGLSILYFPFYMIGGWIAQLNDQYPKDGFSLPYQLSVLYGCYLYTIIGLITFRKILLHFFTDKISALVIILLVFGTNYLLQVSIHAQPAMVHNLVFSLHALTVYFTIKWHSTYKLKYMIGLGCTIGLTAICRPPEILIALVPILYNVFSKDTFQQKMRLIRLHRNDIIIAVFIVFVIVSYQLVYWKIVTGKFIFDSYGENLNEGFNFRHPYILEFLFSFRKGWLIFTPIMIFAVWGMYFFYKNGKPLFFAFIAYFLVNFYVITSWSNWWYGISFSSRAIIPAYVTLAVSLGYFLYGISKYKIKYIFIPVFAGLISLNLFQSWQASRGILNGSRMTKAYYKSVFLQNTMPTDEQQKLLLRDKYSTSEPLNVKEINFNDYKLVYRYVENFDSNSKSQPNIIDSLYVSRNHSFLTNRSYSFAGDIKKKYKEMTTKSYLILKLSAKIFTPANPDQSEARLAITMMHKGKAYEFKCVDTRALHLKSNAWNDIEFYMWTPDFWDRRDVVQGYFWNLSDNPIFVDDLTLEAYEPLVDETVF
ncbi:MAG: hypothetical protein K0S53_2792 [Bacteroidetes bacterium]|jgi:hypothetical protein|nr:hypothetical protein [Bacteroidota bacterium]